MRLQRRPWKSLKVLELQSRNFKALKVPGGIWAVGFGKFWLYNGRLFIRATSKSLFDRMLPRQQCCQNYRNRFRTKQIITKTRRNEIFRHCIYIFLLEAMTLYISRRTSYFKIVKECVNVAALPELTLSNKRQNCFLTSLFTHNKHVVKYNSCATGVKI